MDATPLLLLSIGFLGGAHCVGMCGPLALLYNRGMDRGEAARGHALLNLGRVSMYAALGAAFGLLGTVLDSVATWSALNGYVAVLIGGLIILSGARYLVRGLAPLPSLPTPGGAASVLVRLRGVASGPGITGLGALHAFLPCPITAPVLLYAFSTGSGAAGFFAALLVGLGTVPAVFLTGYGGRRLSLTRRTLMLRGLGAAMLLLGLVPLMHGLMILGVADWMIRIPVFQPLGEMKM